MVDPSEKSKGEETEEGRRVEDREEWRVEIYNLEWIRNVGEERKKKIAEWEIFRREKLELANGTDN